MNVCVIDPRSRQLLKKLQRRSGQRGHHQIWPLRIGSHPVDVRPIASNRAVLNHTLRIGLSLVSNVVAIHRQPDRQVANLNWMVCRIAHADVPHQRIPNCIEALRSLQIINCLHHTSGLAIQSPLQQPSRSIRGKLHLQPDPCSGNSPKRSLVETIRHNRRLLRLLNLLPIIPSLVKHLPPHRKLSSQTTSCIRSPENLRRADHLWLIKVILHPLAGSLLVCPRKTGRSDVVRGRRFKHRIQHPSPRPTRRGRNTRAPGKRRS